MRNLVVRLSELRTKRVKRNNMNYFNIITMAKREIVEILRKYISVLRSEGITINKAYLYGSYLSNTAGDKSDIDIMIITDTEDDYLAGKIWSLTRKVNSKIEPYLVGKTRFIDNVDSPLIDLVKRTGLEIA